MTKVRITGWDDTQPSKQRIVEIWVDAEPTLAAVHPKVNGYIRHVFRKNGYNTVRVEIIE